MFEKEAEEIANKRCHEIMCFGHCSFSSPKHHRCGEWHREYECALKGAEFGYNKANEWHKADEKPKVTKEYLVYLISGYSCRSVTMMIYNAERGFWCADNQNDVVYWKEIVLPKESE